MTLLPGKSTAIMLLVISGILPCVHAADEEGNYAVWGAGSKACISYQRARTTEQSEQYRHFLMGYLSATNVFMEQTYSISGNMTLKEILAWLDEYCDEHQMSAFEDAINQFLAEHHAQRLRRPGRQW